MLNNRCGGLKLGEDSAGDETQNEGMLENAGETLLAFHQTFDFTDGCPGR